MAAITICGDFGAQKNKVWHCFHCSPSISHEVMGWWDRMPWSSFSECWALSQPFHSSLTFIKRLFSSSLSAIRLVSPAYLRLLIFLLAILIPACDLCSPAFCMMYSGYELNKQGDNTQPCCTPFPILNQSVASCPELTVGPICLLVFAFISFTLGGGSRKISLHFISGCSVYVFL